MRYAMVSNETVTSVIIADEEQKTELETALGTTLVDASVYDLAPGDMRVGESWTRNIDGEQVTLTAKERLEDTVAALRLQVDALEAQVSALSGGGDAL